MAQSPESTQVIVRDARKQGWWWVGNETLDIYLPVIGPSAWAVYCTLCRLAGVNRSATVPQVRIMECTGLSLPTIHKAIETLATPEIALVSVTHQQAENGRDLANCYELLEPILVGPRKIKAEAEDAGATSDLWGLRPLDAAIAEMPSAKNRLAVVARLYAMRFDAQAYPFDFARMGVLAKKLSGGATRLCQLIWGVNSAGVRGNPIDFITTLAYKEIKAPVTAATASGEDPQLLAMQKMRETRHAQ